MSGHRRYLRLGTGGIWVLFGLLYKLLNLVPRHRLIVERILGPQLASPATLWIGAGEVLLGAWVLSGRFPLACAATQTLVLVSMNGLELWLARDLLLAPAAMVAANLVFLGAGWYLALSPQKAT